MPSTGFHGTHTLLSDGYVDGLVRLVGALSPHADRGLVWLDELWLDEKPDAEDCGWAWDAIRERFDRLPDRDDHERTAWGVGFDDSGCDALCRLAELTNDSIGSQFVSEIRLVRGGRTALSAIPHHSDLTLDAEAITENAFADAEASLADLDACFVPVEPFAEWKAEERRWSVGSAVCREMPDGRRASCYGVSNLRELRVAADGATLELSWGLGDPISDDALGRGLSWVAERLYRPPERLPCEDTERAASVAAFLAETLRRFDGREIRV